jgi:superfamily I DNA/RNA helicase
VSAPDGVVQVIAPAGSGKTTVLVERVRELIRRGASADRILCMTFNAAAATELTHRLTAAGVTSVAAATFHRTGRAILVAEGLLRGELKRRTPAQWRRLCAIAMRQSGEHGVWIEPPDARAWVADLKLGRLLDPAQWRAIAPDDPRSQTLARLYELYEDGLRDDGGHDFDDHIFLAVRALRRDAGLRARWQARFDRVLVDEYQDIEPAQELLVQILAAPQDSLFTVGDEDQVLYGWRRASAARLVTLDQVYPGLRRVALATNYRCPVDVVVRSARLIAFNRLRFPKPIGPAPGRSDGRATIETTLLESTQATAAHAAAELGRSSRGEIVVLARTTRLLRFVAEACVPPGVKIDAPAEVFDARGAPAAIEAHLRLACDPRTASPDDIVTVLRSPSRGLPPAAEHVVAEHLHASASWRRALDGLGRDERRLAEAATVLDRLRRIDQAGQFVRFLRTTGGLDGHFAEHDQTTGGAEQVALEQLQDAERDARGRTVAGYAAHVQAKRDALLAIRDETDGIELTTIHRAKGREWPTVIVFGFDADQLPHKRALDVSPELAAAGEGIEAERRVAYVALTRAKDRLVVLATRGAESPFLWDAGLVERPSPPQPPPTPAPPGRPSTQRARPPAGPLGKAINDITRVGAGYAVRNSPSRSVGLRVAAWALRGNLVNAENAGATVTVRSLVGEVPGISDAQIAAAIDRSGAPADELVRRLPAIRRGALAAELERLAEP